MTSNQPEPIEGSDEPFARPLSARDIFAAVLRRWWVVALVVVAVVSFSVWRTWRQPRLYSASVTVRVSPNQNLLPGMQTFQRPDFRVDPLISEQQIIGSQEIAERVADQLGLRLQIASPRMQRHQLFGDGHHPRVSSGAGFAEFRIALEPAHYSLSSGTATYGRVPYGDTIRTSDVVLSVPARPAIDENTVILHIVSRAQAASQVRGGVSSRAIPSTDILQITYLGTETVFTREVVNTLARVYEQFSGEMQRVSAESKSAFIRQSLREQEQVLQEAQTALRRFKEQNQVTDVSAEVEALVANIHAFEAERHQAVIAQQLYTELIGRLAAADTVDEELRRLAGTDAVAGNDYIRDLYDRWFTLVRQRETLTITGRAGSGTRVSAVNPDVQALDRQIAETKSQLQEASHLYLQGLASRIRSFDRTIAGLRRQTERYPPLEAEQARLMTIVGTARDAYTNLQSQWHLARIAESADVGMVRVIDQATTPTFAVSPRRRQAVMMALMIGLVLGIGAAVLLDRMDDSVRTADELPERFGTSVLGMIPAIRVSGASRSPASTLMSRLVVNADPRSPVAEAYRSLRTNLAFVRTRGNLRSLVLTSPGPADGKSTTVANLAITFANQGQKTLLVDADLRRAVLDKTFEIPRSPGLTEVIVGSAPLAEAVHETRIANLYVMGSGHFPPNPSELLGSDGMREMIDAAKEEFDFILFDSPPLLAVTDAAVLSTFVDGAVLVVRMGSTARQAVRRALGQLHAVHARLLGAVLNDVDHRKGAYYGGYGYYYAAYYGEGNGRNGSGKLVDRLLGRRGAGV